MFYLSRLPPWPRARPRQLSARPTSWAWPTRRRSGKRAAASLQRGGGNATPPTAAAAALAAAAAELLLRPLLFAVRRTSCCWRCRRGWPRRRGAASSRRDERREQRALAGEAEPPPRRTSTKANASQQNRIEPSLNEKERDKKKLPVFKCASPWPASRRPRPGQSPAGPSGASTLARTCGAATKSRKTAAIGEG